LDYQRLSGSSGSIYGLIILKSFFGKTILANDAGFDKMDRDFSAIPAGSG